jgi:hypothetical protein
MSFPATLVLKDENDANETWVRLKSDTTQVIYVRSDANLNEPEQLIITHQMTSSMKGSDRHLAKFSTTVLDTDGSPYTEVQSFTQNVPRVAVSATIVKRNWARLKSLMTDENQAAILRGEC